MVKIEQCGGNKEGTGQELLAATHCIRLSKVWNLMTTKKYRPLPATCAKLDLPLMDRRLQEARRTNATDIDTATGLPDGTPAALIWLSGDECWMCEHTNTLADGM